MSWNSSRTVWIARPPLVQVLLAMLFFISSLAGCSNPEQIKKERAKTFQKFGSGVARHLLDRNPETIRESMSHIFREELTESTVEKLQREGRLPKTELGILKLINESENEKKSNVITVESAKPLGPVEKDEVPYQISGKVITKTAGKADRSQPFNMKMVFRMNEQTGGWPQVIDISEGAPSLNPAPAPPPAKQKKRRRR